jgi:hypothetical protein
MRAVALTEPATELLTALPNSLACLSIDMTYSPLAIPLLAACPTLECLNFIGAGSVPALSCLVQLRQCPSLTRLGIFDAGHLTVDCAAALASLPSLTALRLQSRLPHYRDDALLAAFSTALSLLSLEWPSPFPDPSPRGARAVIVGNTSLTRLSGLGAVTSGAQIPPQLVYYRDKYAPSSVLEKLEQNLVNQQGQRDAFIGALVWLLAGTPVNAFGAGWHSLPLDLHRHILCVLLPSDRQLRSLLGKCAPQLRAAAQLLLDQRPMVQREFARKRGISVVESSLRPHLLFRIESWQR